MQCKQELSAENIINIRSTLNSIAMFFIQPACWGVTAFFVCILYIFYYVNALDRQEIIPLLAGPFLLPFLSMVLLRHAAKRYAVTFHHRDFVLARLTCGFIYILSMFFLFSHMISVWLQVPLFSALLFFLPIVFLLAMASIFMIAKRIKANFCQIYRKINQSPFILWRKYQHYATTVTKPLIVQNIFYLAIATSGASYYRASDDILGLNISFCTIFWMSFALSFQYIFIPAAYQLFVIQPKIEKVFKSPLMSDYSGILDTNPQLRNAVLSTTAALKPLRYEEVFLASEERHSSS